jgi:chloramphenicol-sensitive protein RarD
MSSASSHNGNGSTAGIAYALGAFGLWGLFPLYFKAVAVVPATEVLAHRIVWSALCVAALLCVLGRWATVGTLARQATVRQRLLVSALLIGANWLVFIWAVAHDRVLQASLGYFVTPLVSVVLGALVLGERLQARQWLAVALAGAGVAWMLAAVGVVPWVALTLAISFSSYGLTRKLADVPAIPGLFVETAILAPVAIAWLAWLAAQGQGHLGRFGLGFDLLLMAAGVVTATPLILFGQATRRLRLASVGLFQYLVPTTQMLLAVFAFGEAFTRNHAVTFGCIWAGLALYAWTSQREPAPPRAR